MTYIKQMRQSILQINKAPDFITQIIVRDDVVKYIYQTEIEFETKELAIEFAKLINV